MNNLLIEEFLIDSDSKEPSVKRKNEFQQKFLPILYQNGLDEVNVLCFFRGIVYDSSIAYVQWLKNQPLDSQLEYYNRIRNNDFLNQNASTSFRCFSNLLSAIILEEFHNDDILLDIVRSIYNYSYDKDHKQLKSAHSTFYKHFVSRISENTQLPSFAKYDENNKFISRFARLVVELSSQFSKTKGRTYPEHILEWVSSGNVNSSAQFNNRIETKDESLHNNSILNIEIKPDNRSDNELTELIESLNKEINTLRKEKSTLNDDLSLIKNLRDNVTIQYEQLKRKDNILEKRINDLASANIELQKQVENLTIELDTKKKQNAKLADEVARRDSILGVYDSHNKNMKQEELNLIASRLKVEYLDFLSAVNMEMTLDLGENMRNQLNSVFKILIKNGIDLERK